MSPVAVRVVGWLVNLRRVLCSRHKMLLLHWNHREGNWPMNPSRLYLTSGRRRMEMCSFCFCHLSRSTWSLSELSWGIRGLDGTEPDAQTRLHMNLSPVDNKHWLFTCRLSLTSNHLMVWSYSFITLIIIHVVGVAIPVWSWSLPINSDLHSDMASVWVWFIYLRVIELNISVRNRRAHGGDN